MKKILTVVGARPQFIKAAVLSRYIRENFNKNLKVIEKDVFVRTNKNDVKTENLIEIIVHTGQHYDKNMSDNFFKQMDIPEPDINLGIGGGSHGFMTGRMIIELEKVVVKEKPDLIIVYGDTNSTLAAALVGAKLKIPVAHIEAGLRSFDKSMPEEVNRVLTDHISKFLFCPTDLAVKNLKAEGIYDEKHDKGSGKICVKNIGDIMYEAFLHYKEKIKDNFIPELKLHKYSQSFLRSNRIEDKKDLINFLENKKFFLLTLHRDFNVDNKEKLEIILSALSEIDEYLVFPLHPRTENRIEKFKLQGLINKNFIIIEPVGYFEMLWLEIHSEKIITDSGGVQKEAYFAKKPCITLRDTTEWIELVNVNANVLCKIDYSDIIEKVSNFYCKKDIFNMKLYGDGVVAEKIIDIILKNSE